MDLNDLFDNTCRDIENGYHVKFYSQCGGLWDDISKQWVELYKVVQATSKVYAENLRARVKGREKLAHLQIEWMCVIRFILHEYPAVNSTAATVQRVWESLIVTVNLQGSLEHSNAIFSSMCRAVFNYPQTKVMAI